MKFGTIALSLLASTGLATPIRRDVGQAIYTLRLTSPVASLNGLYLTNAPSPGNNNSTTLAVYTSSSASKNPTIKFYPVLNPATGLSELRTQESGGTLAVVGSNSLLDFASFADPEAATLPEGTTCDWTSFRLSEDDAVVKYAGGEGRWVVFPSSNGDGEEEAWSVKWKGDDAWTTADYMPVQVVYELVKDE